MKLVAIGDAAITSDMLTPLKELEKQGVEVVILPDDPAIHDPETFTTAMIVAEQQGADALTADPTLLKSVQDADIIVTHVSPINTAVFDAAPNLKHVAVMRSGVENVTGSVAKERGVNVLNAPGRAAPAVADYTLALMLAETKNVARGHAALKQGEWVKHFTNKEYLHDLQNQTVGVIGIGQIGSQVIKRLQGFGPRILVHDPFMTDEQIRAAGYEPASLDQLLKESDIVTIHLRLSDQTAGFMGADEFAKMKPTAYFINTSRAGLVDEDALVDALKNHQIGGAALDVFELEPLPANHRLLQLDNVTVTPHLAGASNDTLANSVRITYDKLKDLPEIKKG